MPRSLSLACKLELEYRHTSIRNQQIRRRAKTRVLPHRGSRRRRGRINQTSTHSQPSRGSAPGAPLPHIRKRGDARRGHDGEPHEARDYYQFTKTPAARRGRRRRRVDGRRARRALGGPAGVITKVVGAAQRRRQVPAESATSAAPGRPRGEARGSRRTVCDRVRSSYGVASMAWRWSWRRVHGVYARSPRRRRRDATPETWRQRVYASHVRVRDTQGLRARRPRQRPGLPRRIRRLAGARGPPLRGRARDP